MYTAISRKVFGKSGRDNLERFFLWLVLRSLRLFKEIWKNSKRAHRRMFASARVGLTATVAGRVYGSYHTDYLLDCRVNIFPDNLARNSCILFMHFRETKILNLLKIFITILSCYWKVLKRNSLKEEQFRGKYTKLQSQRYTNDTCPRLSQPSKVRIRKSMGLNMSGY